MSKRNPILGETRANRNNNSGGIRNVHYDKSTKLFVVQTRKIDGKKKHIACFKDFEKAKIVAEKMHEFNLGNEEELNQFVQWAKNYIESEK